jgi:hypothetical protein
MDVEGKLIPELLGILGVKVRNLCSTELRELDFSALREFFFSRGRSCFVANHNIFSRY